MPIDLHGISPNTLDTLVAIARLLDRGLLGLLLEDLRLQQVADLPFSTEITLYDGSERNLLRAHLSQRHSHVSADTRRLLNELATRNRVELSFESGSGSRLHSTLDREGNQAIFFPARLRWQTAASGSQRTRRPVRRLGIVLARTVQDQDILDSAQLLQQADLVAELYVMSVGPLDRNQLNKLYRPGSRICVQANLNCDPATITQLIRQSAYDLLLLPGDCLKGISTQALETALDKAGGQVLVIN